MKAEARPRADPSLDNIYDQVVPVLKEIEQYRRIPISLEVLCRSELVPDATIKCLIRTNNRPLCLLHISPASAPNAAARSAEAATSIRRQLDSRLGNVIIKPIIQGRVGDRSYVVVPWFSELSHWRIWRRWQSWCLRGPLLAWLREANETLVRQATFPAADEFKRALQHLRAWVGAQSELAEPIHRALERLDHGHWQPRHTFDHNDLWLGNILITKSTPYPFIIIDWGGANLAGFGIYDLLRVCASLRLRADAVRSELVAHARALMCDLDDTAGHLLAALGHLHLCRNHLSEERCYQITKSCWNKYQEARSA